jgi:hypothetical protein
MIRHTVVFKLKHLRDPHSPYDCCLSMELDFEIMT